MNKKTSFSAVVKTPLEDETVVTVELDKSVEDDLTYDEVIDAVYNKCQDETCLDPDYDDGVEIIDLVINDEDGNSYPVVSESMDSTELKESMVYDKFLVLPDARYELTPEAKLWMAMKESGIVDKDSPFDFEAYHSILKKTQAKA